MNAKADTLSRLHAPDEYPKVTAPILPAKIIVSPIQWVPESDRRVSALILWASLYTRQ